MSKIEDLEMLQKLKENGILTLEEFELEKKKILNNNNKQIEETKNKNIESIDSTLKEQNKDRFCSECGNKIFEREKFCGKCGKSISDNIILKTKKMISNNKAILIFLITVILIVIFMHLIMPKKVEIPNLIGMTVEKAQNIMNELNLKVDVSSTGNKQEIISTQSKKEGEIVTEGTSVSITTEEYNKKLKQEKEENKKIETLIKQHAEYVRNLNQGSIKFYNYSKYSTAKNGEKIYKIKYSTSAKKESYSAYYYQLVSVNTDLTEITNNTKLYYESYAYGKQNSNQDDEMMWEAERIWGI